MSLNKKPTPKYKKMSFLPNAANTLAIRVPSSSYQIPILQNTLYPNYFCTHLFRTFDIKCGE